MSTSEQPVDAGTEDYKSKMLARARAALAEQPEQIGPYRILERLGGGGMGEVYRAEQRSPIRREVALKLIKLGMDTKLVIARFEAERQALAMMDHPHIAKVYDAGAEETGRPYFVMEYVKGRPITEYADLNHLNIQERLELFEQVCHAIQHAHHKGVIHRDLKPGNVLVSTQDDRPFAKVIDFGIAKATAQRLTEKTLYTQHEQLLGTPQYMSPEQAEGSLDIDTRTDVYSLGVLLYELLAGSTPFGSDELKAMALEQIKKMIQEVDPPKPSTRISMSGTTLPTLAASRRTEPKKLGLLVRGELDWIVMKSLEKDRARRYDTPASLASDVRRYITGQPVEAAPPSWGYRVRKYVRRRKGAVAATAAIAMLLVAGTIVSTLLAVRANRAERQALDEKAEVEQEKTEAQVQRDAAVVANQKAEAQAQRAEEATAKAFRTESELCVDAGIAAEDKQDAGLAMLWLARALKLDAGDSSREEVQRRRLGALYSQQARPVDVVMPDVPGIVHNGMALRWSEHGVKTVDARTGDPAGASIDYDKSVYSAEFSPDGRFVIGQCEDGKDRYWETATGKLFIVLEHGVDAHLSPDGRYCVEPTPGPGKDEYNQLHVRDAVTGKSIGKELLGRDNEVSPDSRLIITGNYDSTQFRIWKLSTGELVSTIMRRFSGTSEFAFSPDSKRVATLIGQYYGEGVSGWAEARVWEASTGKPISPVMHLDSQSGYQALVKFSSDGSHLLVSIGGTWKLWDSKTGGQVFEVQQPGGSPRAVFSTDDSLVATYSWSGGENGLVVRSTATGNPQALSIRQSSPCLTGFGFSEDNKYLVTLDNQSGIQVWDLDAVNPAGRQVQQPQAVNWAEFSPDGKVLYTHGAGTGAHFDQHVARVWDAASLEPLIPPLLGNPDKSQLTGDLRVVGMGFLADPRYVQMAGNCFDCETGLRVGMNLQGSPQPDPYLVSPNRHYVFAAQGDDAGIWELETGTTVLTKIAARNSDRWGDTWYHPAAFSPDSETMAIDGKILALPSGNKICDLERWGDWDRTYQFTFSADGHYLMNDNRTYEGRNYVGIWDAKTGKRIFPPERAGSISGLARLSNDGSEVYVDDEQRGNRVWNTSTGNAITANMSRDGHPADAAFSYDQKYLAIGDGAGYVSIWEVASGKRVARFEIAADDTNPYIHSVRFSPDGNRLVAANGKHAQILEFRGLQQPAEQLELLAEYLSGRRIDEIGGIVPLSIEEFNACRTKIFTTCPELFRAASEQGETKGVPMHYRKAVEAQVAAAKTDGERKELAKRLTHCADIELYCAWMDEAILLNETAVRLDDSLLEARDNLALSYLRKERYDDAMAIYKKYQGRHFDHQWYGADEKDFVFGQDAADNIDQIRDQGHDAPQLAEIERLLAPTLGGGKINASETKRLRDAVGKLATVEGNIAKLTVDDMNDQVNLSLNPNFELHLSNTRDFQKEQGEITAWKGKHVAVTGVIQGDEKDKPMWVDVDRPSQIEVLSGGSRAPDSGPRRLGK